MKAWKIGRHRELNSLEGAANYWESVIHGALLSHQDSDSSLGHCITSCNKACAVIFYTPESCPTARDGCPKCCWYVDLFDTRCLIKVLWQANANLSKGQSSGYVDPNFPNPGGKNDTSVIIYCYTPSIAIAAFAAAWFLFHLITHTVQNSKYRNWYWMTFSTGLIFEILGYIARSLSAKKDSYSLIYFIINYFFIVTAPVFLAAGVYTILSALIARLCNKYSFLRPTFILVFFITSDAISPIMQVAGASLIGVKESRREDPTSANNILLAGLAYQVFAMSIFVVLMTTFQICARREIKQPRLQVFYLSPSPRSWPTCEPSSV